MVNSVSDFTTLNNSRYFLNKPQTSNTQPQRLSKNQRLGIQFSTALSVIGSLALLAKLSKTPYSFKPSKILATPFKDTFLGKIEYDIKTVPVVGAGSCLGGLLGGVIFDKNKNNRQAKVREALVQYTNIVLPIATVHCTSLLGEAAAKKLPKMNKPIGIAAPLIGLAAGIVAGNKLANKLNQIIFHKKDNRPVELTDMSAHLDDICMTSQYIKKDNILTKSVSRFIPLALMVPGCEIGKKQEKTFA